jgi:hypothetical protein
MTPQEAFKKIGHEQIYETIVKALKEYYQNEERYMDDDDNIIDRYSDYGGGNNKSIDDILKDDRNWDSDITDFIVKLRDDYGVPENLIEEALDAAAEAEVKRDYFYADNSLSSQHVSSEEEFEYPDDHEIEIAGEKHPISFWIEALQANPDKSWIDDFANETNLNSYSKRDLKEGKNYRSLYAWVHIGDSVTVEYIVSYARFYREAKNLIRSYKQAKKYGGITAMSTIHRERKKIKANAFGMPPFILEDQGNRFLFYLPSRDDATHALFDELIEVSEDISLEDDGYVTIETTDKNIAEKVMKKAKEVLKANVHANEEPIDDESHMSFQYVQDIADHAAELLELIDPSEDMEDWVDAKITMARQQLLDVTHYLSTGEKLDEALEAEEMEEVQGPPEEATEVESNFFEKEALKNDYNGKVAKFKQALPALYKAIMNSGEAESFQGGINEIVELSVSGKKFYFIETPGHGFYFDGAGNYIGEEDGGLIGDWAQYNTQILELHKAAKVVATGEPDGDYDVELFDTICEKLKAGGFECMHKEFDKYQGPYLSVKKGGKHLAKLWISDMYVSGEKQQDPRIKWRSAMLIDAEGDESSANSGDYFMMSPNDVFQDATLILSPIGGGEDVTIENPKKSDLPDITEVQNYISFKGTPNEHIIFLDEKSQYTMEVVVPNGDKEKTDVSEIFDFLKETFQQVKKK